MRYLVLSDIHANLEALEAVLAAADGPGYDRVLVLGDLVGYGPDPNAVVDRIRALEPASIVRGNHDKVVAGLEDAEAFNRVAQQAAGWTLQALSPESRAYLVALPIGPAYVDDLIEICHGTPDDEDAYVANELDALRALREARRPVCLYGHTHIPIACRLADAAFDVVFRGARGLETLRFDPTARFLVNPGSVGQPRDGDPRAAFAILDRHATPPAMRWWRVPYDIDATRAKVLAAGLPAALAERLKVGR